MTDEPAVRVDATGMRMQPNAMRQLSKATGRSFEQLLNSDESADKFQAMAFIELKRRHPDWEAAALWELAGEVEVELGTEPPDPTGNGRPTISPPFAVGRE
jgi:hemerythrin-like domain-containing protein